MLAVSHGITAGEVEDLRGHLRSTRLQLEENERHKLALSEERNKLEKVSRNTFLVSKCQFL